MRNRITLFIVLFSVCYGVASAQTQTQADALIRKGNLLYEQQKYNDAAADYQKAIAKNPNYTPGLFNLGNSLYQQKKFDASRQVMTATANATKDKKAKAGVNYNIGNTYMAEKKWEDAMNAYKQTLRNNPQDLDAKYNLSYARQMMQQEQNKKKQDQKDKKEKKDDKGKDKSKDKDKKGNEKEKGNDDKNDNKDKDDQHPQSQPSKLSQQQADQVLNALQNEEKKLQDKLNKEKGIPAKMEKDW